MLIGGEKVNFLFLRDLYSPNFGLNGRCGILLNELVLYILVYSFVLELTAYLLLLVDDGGNCMLVVLCFY